MNHKYKNTSAKQVLIHIFLIVLCLIAIKAEGKVIQQMESTGQETKEQFIVRVGHYLHNWTKRNDKEACGYIITNGEVFAVVVETQDRKTECLSSQSYTGWTMTGETIHSHPHRRKTKATAFSDTDYETPGYLVDSGELLYQNGKGTEIEIHDYH